MPVPIRDDGSAGPTRRLILFVHGFNSNAVDCWGAMLDRLQREPAISGIFDFACFEYETSLLRLARLNRIPTIAEIATELGAYLDRKLIESESDRDRYIDTTLVGHSMGGLILQAYLLQRLDAGRGKELDRLRQVILFATPNFGSDLLMTVRSLIAIPFPNPQEEALRKFSAEIEHIQHGVRDRIIDAHKRSDHSYPLPFYCFWGDSDNVVPKISAIGHFPHGEPLRGDHFSLHKPLKVTSSHGLDDNRDQCYQAFVESVLHPHGHKHIWEVDTFLYSVRVSPLPHGTVIQAIHGEKRRPVVTDNSAEVTRKICFARNNRCHEPFILRYATRNDGWIDPTMPHHVTSPEKLRQYDDTGSEVIAEVAPDQSRISTLSMRVFKGFDAGHRDYHMHIGKKGYFRRLEFVVDLQDYLAAGWRISRGPHLYFHPDDPGDHRLCANRNILDPDPTYEYDARGIWSWRLDHVKDGVIDIAWDVTPPGVRVTRESPSVIELHPGEHAVFGYGSLLSLASLERTLCRRYSGPFVVCDLIGWRRAWNISMPNSTYCYSNDSGSRVTPEKIIYLNIHQEQGRRVNGIVFIISDDDLKGFDDREWIYERVPINDYLRGVAIVKGTAWTYVGRPEHRILHPQSPRHAAIRQSYLDIVHTGITELGSDFLVGYDASTDAVPAMLVVHDRRHEQPLSGST